MKYPFQSSDMVIKEQKIVPVNGELQQIAKSLESIDESLRSLIDLIRSGAFEDNCDIED